MKWVAAYLVKETVTVTNLASITSADNNLWNSVAIRTANTATNLSAAGLIDGSYKLYTVDAAGNLSVASANSVTIDTQASTASVTTATINNTNNAVVQSSEVGTAFLVKDTVTVSNLASITSAANNLWNSVAISTANTATNLSAAGLIDGTYQVYTVDLAGNLSTAATDRVTIDTSAPTANLTVATIKNTSNAVVQSSESGTAYLVKDTVTVSDVASITSAADNLWNSVAISAANAATNLSAAGLLDGTYKVYTVDLAGNLSAASTNSLTLDTLAPTASVTAAAIKNTSNAAVKSSELGMAYLVKDTVVVTSLASITNATDNLWNSVAISTVNTATNLSAAGLVDGAYKVYTVDVAGNLSVAAANSVTIDTQAPTVSVTAVTINNTNNAVVQSNEVGNAYLVKDTVTVSNLASITSAANNLWNSVIISAANTATNLSADGLIEGTYKVYAVDTAGNLSTAAINSVTIDNTAAPTASVIASTIKNTSNVVVQSTGVGSAYLVKDTVAVTNLSSITNAADNLWNSVTMSAANTATNLSAAGLVDGTYKVYTVDASGNLSAAASNSVTIDNTAPITTVSALAFSADTGSSSADFNTNTAVQILSGTLSVATATGEVVKVSLDNGTTWQTATNTVGSTSFTYAGNLIASNTLQVRVEDAAGNVGTAKTQAYILDTVVPTIAISSDKSSLKVGQTATITFALSEVSTDFNASDVVVSGGVLSNFTGSGTSYTATFTPTANSTTAGSISVASAKFSDAAGNQNTDGSDANNTVSLTINTVPIDTTAPVFQSAVLGSDGKTLTMTYGEALNATTAVASAFTVTADSSAVTVSRVVVSGSSVVLTLGNPVQRATVVTVAYTAPTSNPATSNCSSTEFSR